MVWPTIATVAVSLVRNTSSKGSCHHKPSSALSTGRALQLRPSVRSAPGPKLVVGLELVVDEAGEGGEVAAGQDSGPDRLQGGLGELQGLLQGGRVEGEGVAHAPHQLQEGARPEGAPLVDVHPGVRPRLALRAPPPPRRRPSGPTGGASGRQPGAARRRAAQAGEGAALGQVWAQRWEVELRGGGFTQGRAGKAAHSREGLGAGGWPGAALRPPPSPPRAGWQPPGACRHLVSQAGWNGRNLLYSTCFPGWLE